MLWKTVCAHPERAAIVQGGKRITYNELHDLSGRCAAGLRLLHVGPGDCVAFVLPNCPEFVASFLACAWLRAVLLPLDPKCSGDELRHLLADVQARAVITGPSGASALAGTGASVVTFEQLIRSPADPMPADQFSGPVLYLYTSGSTAVRKRLCCTQENLYWEAYNFVETVGLTSADNILCTIPLWHSYGIGNCLLDALYTGSTLVLTEADDVPFAARCRRVFELIQEEAIRFFPGVPYQFQILASLPDRRSSDLACLRLCISSGDVLSRHTYDRFMMRYALPIRSLYGSTEAGSIAINVDPDGHVEPGSVGPPLRNVAIEIRDAEGRVLPTGMDGEIWVKSPTIPPSGYDNRGELNHGVFRGGFTKREIWGI
jgi:long-chain acyl-CoA synthetase